jgi:nucleoside 2-deoxyribosyltransferase
MRLDKKIYLAGPEVFFPNAKEIGKEKKEICSEYGFEGLYPLDANFTISKDIFKANVSLINQCDYVVADLTPFRGPSADAGTIWKVGYAYGIGKPIFGYSNDSVEYKYKVDDTFIYSEEKFNQEELLIEDFGNIDNLMIIESLTDLSSLGSYDGCYYTNMKAFRVAILSLKQYLFLGHII